MDIHSRLQSRISKRRNLIRQVETDVAVLKVRRREVAQIADSFSNGQEVLHAFNENLRDARRFVNELADDQRLDKRLKNMIVANDRHIRFFGYGLVV